MTCSAFKVQLGGASEKSRAWGQCLAVRIEDGLSKLRSRLGNELALASQKAGLQPIGIIAYREAGMEDDGGSIKLSLRGVGEKVDTTCISQAFGGGGHRLASSCIVPLGTFESWRTD